MCNTIPLIIYIFKDLFSFEILTFGSEGADCSFETLDSEIATMFINGINDLLDLDSEMFNGIWIWSHMVPAIGYHGYLYLIFKYWDTTYKHGLQYGLEFKCFKLLNENNEEWRRVPLPRSVIMGVRGLALGHYGDHPTAPRPDGGQAARQFLLLYVGQKSLGSKNQKQL